MPFLPTTGIRVKSGLLILMSTAALAACGDDNSKATAVRGGTAIIAASGSYGSLFPVSAGTTTARQVTELVYDYLTEVGLSLNTFDDKTFARRLARSRGQPDRAPPARR